MLHLSMLHTQIMRLTLLSAMVYQDIKTKIIKKRGRPEFMSIANTSYL